MNIELFHQLICVQDICVIPSRLVEDQKKIHNHYPWILLCDSSAIYSNVLPLYLYSIKRVWLIQQLWIPTNQKMRQRWLSPYRTHKINLSIKAKDTSIDIVTIVKYR